MSFITKINTLSVQDYMSDEQLAVFKDELLMRKLNLVTAQEKSKRELAEMDIVATDPADKAGIQLEIDTLNGEINKRNLELKRVTNALEYIRLGDYGFCKTCGEEIGLPRLKANPTSLMDVNCQDIHEIKSRQETGRNVSLRYS